MPFRKLKHMPTAVSVMTPFPHSIDIDAPLATARAMMDEHNIHHLPVKRENELVGIITERDIAHALDPGNGLPSADKLRVLDAVILEVYVADLHAPLDGVLMHMAEYHIGSALITKEERLAGVFTMTDACRVFAEYLRSQFPTYEGGDDAA